MARRTNNYAAFFAIAVLAFLVGILSAHIINLPPSGGSSPPLRTPPPDFTPPGNLTAHIFVAKLPSISDPSNNHAFRVGVPTPLNGGTPCAGPGTFEMKPSKASYSLTAVGEHETLTVVAMLQSDSDPSDISFDGITASSSTFASQKNVGASFKTKGGSLVEYCVP